MKTAILSINGKPLGYVIQTPQGFKFEHKSGAWEGYFATAQDAQDAFTAFHNTWFETHYG